MREEEEEEEEVQYPITNEWSWNNEL